MAKARKTPGKSKPSSTAESAQRKKAAYPYHTLKTSIGLGFVVSEGGGDRVGVPKSVVAAALDMDQGSSAFSMLVASAKCYGIVDGYKELMLTDGGRDYFMPTTTNASREAELGFLSQPSVYSFLIEKFDGSTLPAAGMLGNVLTRQFKIAPSWSGRVAQNFLTAANDLGVLDQGGRLRYDAAKHKAGAQPGRSLVSVGTNQPQQSAPESVYGPYVDLSGASVEATMSEPSPMPQSVQFIPNVHGANVWVYRDAAGATVKLETPSTLTTALWDRLKAYIEILKPDAQAKEG
jgi:hypothetical protein